MGNTASCSPSIITSTSPEVRILASTTGTLKVYSNPLRPSDVISEFPGHFLSDPTALHVGHRVAGLPADEILQPRRQLYLLLPMEMLYSVLTHDELASISHKAAEALSLYSNVNRYSSLRKIFPVCIFPSDLRRGSRRTSVEEDGSGSGGDGGYMGRRENLEEKQCCSKQGSWRPALETIVEG